MASVVDICNLALASLGDSATVASIDPPEGSAQAEHCARFYPIALASLLELHNWGFSMRRTVLAEVANTSTTWDYAYAAPSGLINIIAVLAPDAADDYSTTVKTIDSESGYTRDTVGGSYLPQDFSSEINEVGNTIILTNQPNAVLRYTTLVTDTTEFSPLFIESLVALLASKLAGPIIKGAEGRQESKAQMAVFTSWMAKAKSSDAGQRHSIVKQNVSWINAR